MKRTLTIQIDFFASLAFTRAMIRRYIYQLLRFYWRLRKPIVLGAQTLVLQGNNVLLVRLSYADGWHLPGGGVKHKESFRMAALRELEEECGIHANSLKLFHVYHSTRTGKIDHLALFATNDFARLENHQPDPEIAELKFFPLDALPSNLIGAASRRIQEWRGTKPLEDQW